MPSRTITPGTFTLLSPQLLADARSDPARTWAVRGLCTGADPEIFFPPSDGASLKARQICAGCPVRGLCLAYAVIADEPFGIWGGLDRHERRSLRRQLQRQGSLPAPRNGSAA